LKDFLHFCSLKIGIGDNLVHVLLHAADDNCSADVLISKVLCCTWLLDLYQSISQSTFIWTFSTSSIVLENRDPFDIVAVFSDELGSIWDTSPSCA
jgi:hypothetical protein